MRRFAAGWLIVGAEAVPAIELHRLGGELPQPGLGEPREDGVERLLLADAGVEGVLALEAGRDPKRLATVLAEPADRTEQELLVGDRLAHFERGMPRREDRQVVVVELLDGLCVVHEQLVVGDLVDPGAHDFAEQLPACLAADALRDDPDRFLWLDEAEGHAREGTWGSRRKAGIR